MSPFVNRFLMPVVLALVSGWATGVFGGRQEAPVKVEIRCDCGQRVAPTVKVAEADTSGPPQAAPSDSPEIPSVGAIRSVDCTDAQGHSGSFQAVVLLDSYNWTYKTTDLVEFNHQPIDFLEVLKQPALGRLLAEAKQIVAVGTASCEASDYFWGHLAEERRAGRRAHQLAGWISRLHPQHVHELNVGRFQKPCDAGSPEETWKQRRIVLISVTERAEDLDLESCLLQSMKSDRQLGFLVENYSKFELDEDWE